MPRDAPRATYFPPPPRLVAVERPTVPPSRKHRSDCAMPAGCFEGAQLCPSSRGFIHSFTSQLNLSAFHGIGGTRRDCVARAKGVLGVV